MGGQHGQFANCPSRFTLSLDPIEPLSHSTLLSIWSKVSVRPYETSEREGTPLEVPGRPGPVMGEATFVNSCNYGLP